jgi:hypothetical protein
MRAIDPSGGPGEGIALERLRESAAGTSYASAIVVEAQRTVVSLAYPFGQTVEVATSVLPETPRLPATFRSALAVRVCVGRRLSCSVLGATTGGPVRQSITFSEALGLARTGVHTVFVTS